jgi:hypothetical protein
MFWSLFQNQTGFDFRAEFSIRINHANQSLLLQYYPGLFRRHFNDTGHGNGSFKMAREKRQGKKINKEEPDE